MGPAGLADAQNIALNQRLEESLGTVDKVMLALPRLLGMLGLRAGSGTKRKGLPEWTVPSSPKAFSLHGT